MEGLDLKNLGFVNWVLDCFGKLCGPPSFLQLKLGCFPHPGLYVSEYGELKGFLW